MSPQLPNSLLLLIVFPEMLNSPSPSPSPDPLPHWTLTPEPLKYNVFPSTRLSVPLSTIPQHMAAAVSGPLRVLFAIKLCELYVMFLGISTLYVVRYMRFPTLPTPTTVLLTSVQ